MTLKQLGFTKSQVEYALENIPGTVNLETAISFLDSNIGSKKGVSIGWEPSEELKCQLSEEGYLPESVNWKLNDYSVRLKVGELKAVDLEKNAKIYCQRLLFPSSGVILFDEWIKNTPFRSTCPIMYEVYCETGDNSAQYYSIEDRNILINKYRESDSFISLANHDLEMANIISKLVRLGLKPSSLS